MVWKWVKEKTAKPPLPLSRGIGCGKAALAERGAALAERECGFGRKEIGFSGEESGFGRKGVRL